MSAKDAVVETQEAHLGATQCRNKHQEVGPFDLVAMLDTRQRTNPRVNTFDAITMGLLMSERFERAASSVESGVGTGYPFACKATPSGCEQCDRSSECW